MIINHNIAALNTYRQLSTNNVLANKSLEKLSSGLRIVRAGDDAAGLAISEKMRAQIRGLEMASKNAQDAISLIQTAEGALNETHSILQRMRELAVQSANDTNTAVDREELQKEVDQLSQELSRIGNTTEFNTQKLLNGTFKGVFHIGANEKQNLTVGINDMRAYALGVVGDATIEVTASVTDGGNTVVDIADGTYTVQLNDQTGKYELINANGQAVAESTNGKSWAAKSGDDTLTFTEAVKSGTVTISSGTATATGQVANSGLQAGVYKYDGSQKALLDSNGEVIAVSTDAITFKDYAGNTLITFSAAITDGTEVTVRGIDISSKQAANSAVTTINNAIEKVSAERSKLGAYQNRLEHTINNLGTSSENLTAAESRIRDIDMAKEMMQFAKMNILQQAATAMLAQANQQPQMVLQLLR
ncbi:flagellin domain protein [Desulfofundulus kuznetsovii DSM 6115]|uniref:Flagellin n=1 Tax=Desulfofundulus kuznetsovii (strain DSM 6115 / VKM B-1805 / 17) TaxID=760568 RepID=A0AAU8PBH9_DESK7|nr:flagellin domain protein [Desulfofundulus kuznetsovii DSM 6115]